MCIYIFIYFGYRLFFFQKAPYYVFYLLVKLGLNELNYYFIEMSRDDWIIHLSKLSVVTGEQLR